MLYKKGINCEYIIDDYVTSADNLKDMLQSFSNENPQIDINIITPTQRYMKEFLEWFMTSEYK